jgi:hypothetical protein
MSHDSTNLLDLVTAFEKRAELALFKISENKIDPRAKVRNRGIVCVPAERAKDNKDHFPINNIDQARNAIARVNQYSKVPDWYKGSLQSLVNLVIRRVHSKYPSIEISKD